MAFSLLNPIEQEILSQIKREVNLLKGVKSESELLELQLHCVVASINDQLTKWRGDYVGAVEKNHMAVMRGLAYDMEDCLERFLYQVRLKKKGGTFDGLVPLFWHKGKKVFTSAQLAKKMKKLHKRLELVNKLVPLPANAIVGEQEESESEPVMNTPVVGISRVTEKLVELLNITGRDPGRLRVIAIVGFGGSGKTTLANQVYARTRQDGVGGFPLRAWIDRAEYSDASGLLRKIIKKFWGVVAEEEIRGFEGRDLQRYIMEKLPGKRYLIVLDDFDNEDHWSWVKNTFNAESVEGSRIIVITTLRSISNHCRNHSSDCYVYQMRAIGENACKQISRLDDDHQHSEKLLKICGGHPLALSSVNNHLVGVGGMRTQEKCKALCENLGKFLHDAQEDDRNNFKRLRSVLMTNLVGLGPSTDRSCLLYLGIFPNGCPIKISKLTRRWVAEGYGRDNNSIDNSIDKFIQRNIIQPIGISNSSKQWKVCETLNILQEFALHKSISDNFIMAVDDGLPLPDDPGKKRNTKVRHISVNVNGVETSGTDLSCVRSLTISKKAGLGGAFSKLRKYDLLRVLDMEDCCEDVSTHLNDICNLWNLRYLSLGTNITKELPGQFYKKLEYLGSLQLSKEDVSELPVQVIGMPNLKHLNGKIKFTYKKENDALVQSKNSKLEIIAGAVASAEEKGFLVDMMPNIKNLRKVKIWCCTSKGKINQLDIILFQAIKCYTDCDMQRSLSIDFGGLTHQEMEKLQDQGPHYKFFEKLLQETTSNMSYSYLRCLKLCGTLTSIPNFLVKLAGLKMLCLSLTILKQGHLARLSEVGTLVHLKLAADHIGSNPLQIPVKGFQKLESLGFEVKGSSADKLKIDIIPYTLPATGETVFDQLPELVSLQLLCDVLPDPSGIQITQFTKLQEIELHQKFKGDARKKPWEEAAWKHPNRPNVLPSEIFDDGETAAPGTTSEQSAARGTTSEQPAARDQSGDHDNSAQELLVDNRSLLFTPMTLLKKAASKLWNFRVKVPGKAVPQNPVVQQQ